MAANMKARSTSSRATGSWCFSINDPVPCPDPAERAVKMAIAMREEAGKLIVTSRRDGCELGFGAGIAQGYATLGQIGFSERSGYTAIGTVCNLAARLCAEAKDGQILVSSRVARAAEAVAIQEGRDLILAVQAAPASAPAPQRPLLSSRSWSTRCSSPLSTASFRGSNAGGLRLSARYLLATRGPPLGGYPHRGPGRIAGGSCQVAKPRR
jgi:hypothetical protein